MEQALDQAVPSGIFANTHRDAFLLGAALAHGAALLGAGVWQSSAEPTALLLAPVLGLLICWGSNTVSHVHLHTPLFSSRAQNRAFSLYLTLLLGVPQRWWRRRHFAHHADRAPRAGWRPDELREAALVGALWLLLLAVAPRFFALVYAPGYALGMLFCTVQGHFEHRHQGSDISEGISHHGRLHNLLWFNDGHHAEHHRAPSVHWSKLPERRAVDATVSPLPPLLRWATPLLVALDRIHGEALGWLERLVLTSGPLQRAVIGCHIEAFQRMLPRLKTPPQRVLVVGGGLFPRTVLVLGRVLPSAEVEVIDASAESIARARRYLGAHGGGAGVVFRQGIFDETCAEGFDLVITPLAYVGARGSLYEARRSAAVLVHDWAWRARGDAGTLISLLLLKRLNLVLPSR